jgi:diacylglycerol kinase family enzyme
MKQRWGPLAYTRAAAASVDELRPYRVTLHIDDAPPKRMTALNVIVANARYAGGGIGVASEASTSDGLLDIVVVHPGGMLDLTGLAARFLTGSALQSDLVEHARGRRVTVHAEPAMPFNVDGDLVGEGAFTFECVPAAVQVLCPQGP